MDALAAAAPGLVVVEVTDFSAAELRASPEVLRATLLRFGWSDDDFDTNAFCASDLFVESV